MEYIVNQYNILENADLHKSICNSRFSFTVIYGIVDEKLYAGYEIWYHYSNAHWCSGAMLQDCTLDEFIVKHINYTISRITEYTDKDIIDDLKRMRNDILQPQLSLF